MKKSYLVLAALLTAGVLVGCSNKKKTTSSESSAASSESVSSDVSSNDTSTPAVSSDDGPKVCAAADLYVRGSINSWSANDEYKLTVSGDDTCVYTTSVTLHENDEFKVADAAWGTYNYGYANLVANDAFADNGGNIKVVTGGVYTLNVNITTGSITATKTADLPTQKSKTSSYYVKGSYTSDWKEFEMTKSAEGVYTYTFLALADGQFCMYQRDHITWSDDTESTTETYYKNGGESNLTYEKGLVTITYTAANDEANKVTVNSDSYTEVTVDEAITLAKAQVKSTGTDAMHFDPNNYLVTGVITSLSINGSGYYTAILAGTSSTFTVYGSILSDGETAPVVGDTIKAAGHIVNYNGTYELTSGTDAGTSEVYGRAYIGGATHNEYDVTSSVVDGAGTETTGATVTLPEGKVTSGSTFNFSVTQTDTSKIITSVTVAGKSVTKNDDGTYTVTAGYDNKVVVEIQDPANMKSVMKYNGGVTTNMTETGNAASVNLSSDIFIVTADKGNVTNLPGLNASGYIAIYGKKSSSSTENITVSVASGYIIDSITMTFSGTAYNNVMVATGTTLLTATDDVYTVNASSFMLGNANTDGSQVRITSCTITYHMVTE